MKKLFLTLIALFIVIQVVPYGRNHTNPKVLAKPNWNSPETEKIFMKACGDCHSNETKWPLYSNIAPISWLIYNHVQEGREHFNVSMWGKQQKNEGDEAVEEVREGEMPPKSYLLAHPEAQLSESEKRLLLNGLKSTFGEKEASEHEEDRD